MEAEVSTEVAVAAEVFTAGEDSPAADALVLVEAARLAAGIAAVTVAADTTVAVVVMAGAVEATAGAAEVGEEAMGTAGAAGAGDLALAGLGTMVGDIRMATTATIQGIMRHIPILIRILPTVIRKTT